MAVQALRRLKVTTSPRDPTLMVKERELRRRTAWVVVERLKGWNQAAPTNSDKGGGEQLGWQLAGQVGARIVPRQRKSRNMQGFGKIFDNGVN